jgi:hypothetical protein
MTKRRGGGDFRPCTASSNKIKPISTSCDINDKTADIDKMQAQVDADRRAIADAEDELRKSGGDPGWAR